jgi:hypothetical protein
VVAEDSEGRQASNPVATFVSNELEEFHRFVAEKLAKGEASLSPEAAVDQWRELHPTSEDLAEDVAAVKEALADMVAGDQGIPLAEFDQEFRAKHGLLTRS